MRRSASTAPEFGPSLNALLLIGSIRWFTLMYSTIIQSPAPTSYDVLQAYVAATLALEQSAYYLLRIPIPNLCPAMLPSAFPYPSLPHMARKRTLAWFCGDTFLLFHQGCNCPENGGDASGHQPTPAQEREHGASSERKEAIRLRREAQLRTMPTLLGYTILGYLLVRDLTPTWGPVVWRPTSMVGGLLLLLLDSLLLSPEESFSCDASGPNTKLSRSRRRLSADEARDLPILQRDRKQKGRRLAVQAQSQAQLSL